MYLECRGLTGSHVVEMTRLGTHAAGKGKNQAGQPENSCDNHDCLSSWREFRATRSGEMVVFNYSPMTLDRLARAVASSKWPTAS